jgi:hypothetical protein
MQDYSVEWLGVVVAVIAQFGLGFLWYSQALFGKRWLGALGRTTQDMQQNASPAPWIVVALSSVVSAVFVSAVADWAGAETVADGLVVGVYVGFVVALAVAAGHLFEQRARPLVLINAGHELVRFLLIGLVIGAFQ